MQKPVDWRGSKKVFAPDDMRHPLRRIIDNNREMVGGRTDVSTRQHDVAERSSHCIEVQRMLASVGRGDLAPGQWSPLD